MLGVGEFVVHLALLGREDGRREGILLQRGEAGPGLEQRHWGNEFEQVAGGLNQMTIARFERLVAASPFKLAGLECVPIRKLKRFHNRLTREFATAFVRCRLIRRA